MKALIKLVKNLAKAIIGLIDFIIAMIGDLIYLIGLLGDMLSTLPAFFTWLPTAVGSMVMVTFSVLVVLRILGRSK